MARTDGENLSDHDLLIRVHENVKSMKETMDNNEKRFASKWVEKFNIGLISLTVASVLVALINTVVKAVGRG